MKVVFMTGSHMRHAYIARCMENSGCLSALVIERREEFVPEPPVGIDASLGKLFRKHFAGRLDSERAFFGDASLPDVPILNVSMANLNANESLRFISDFAPDLLISYGIHKLTPAFLDNVNAKYKWNIHGGLSPWYRGVTTLFWPSYMLEPQMTGMTVHELTDDIDGGAVIHQTVASLVRGDGLHDLACRAVVSLGDDICELFNMAANDDRIESKTQKTTGRIWRSSDWRPEHLQLIYDFYDNRIVDCYLDGRFAKLEPNLVRLF